MRPRPAALLAAAAVLAAACGDGGAPTGGGDGREQGSLTVLAAASLTEAFDELGRRFRATRPGVTITFGYDASSTLARQVVAGAPADVLATADEVAMERAASAGAVDGPAVFASNTLAIVVAAGNPHDIRGVADLARPGLIVVLCAEEVPCGRLGRAVLDRAGVRARPRSLEPNVRGVVSKVALGEADAGLVYVTDVRAGGGAVEGVALPDAANVATRYPIAVVRSSRNRAAATAFVDFVRSAEGRSVLGSSGFAPA